MAAGDPAAPPWLRSMPLAPEYHPTESEFADPITFLARIEREAAAFGICKVVPPFPPPSRRFAFDNVASSLSDFTTRHQELGGSASSCLKQVWQSGEHYSLERFESKARSFARSRIRSDPAPDPLSTERVYWENIDSDKPLYVEYANDVPGSGFAAPKHTPRARKRLPDAGGGWQLSTSPWNLQVIARAPGSLTRFMPDDVPGVTSPMVYVAMLFSWFAWHVEDHELHSLNFLHFGAPKTWYAVPGERAAEFEEVIRMKAFGGEFDPLASLAKLGEKTTVISPKVLVDAGLPCCRLVQYPGEFVVTFPRAYHTGFSHGFNCGEAANFSTPQWLKFAKEAAVRRAAMNFLPMLSHQHLLYLLAISLIARTPKELLSGMRTSRLRDRKKEEREFIVKKAFLQDIVGENTLMCALLKKRSTVGAVMWEPNMLPSQISHVLSSQSSASPTLYDRSKDATTVSTHVIPQNYSADSATRNPEIGYAHPGTADISIGQSNSDGTHVDEGDLPFGLRTDSGSLACVACGILGYPFMAIVQPSDKALEELSLAKEEFHHSSGDMDLPTKSSDWLKDKNLSDVVCKNVYDSNVKEQFYTKVPSWNTETHFVRPRIFCLHHALEVEQFLGGKWGAQVLIICHSDFLTIKAVALAIADEIGTQFDCDDVPMEKASSDDMQLINIAIDEEGYVEDGSDWTSKLGFNLKYCVKLRKQSPVNQEPLLSSVGRMFAAPSSAPLAKNVKWLCRKARTPHRVVGYVFHKLHSGPINAKTEPTNSVAGLCSFEKVYQSRRKRHAVIAKVGSSFENQKTSCEVNSVLDAPNLSADCPQSDQLSEHGLVVGVPNEVSGSLCPEEFPSDSKKLKMSVGSGLELLDTCRVGLVDVTTLLHLQSCRHISGASQEHSNREITDDHTLSDQNPANSVSQDCPMVQEEESIHDQDGVRDTDCDSTEIPMEMICKPLCRAEVCLEKRCSATDDPIGISENRHSCIVHDSDSRIGTLADAEMPKASRISDEYFVPNSKIQEEVARKSSMPCDVLEVDIENQQSNASNVGNGQLQLSCTGCTSTAEVERISTDKYSVSFTDSCAQVERISTDKCEAKYDLINPLNGHVIYYERSKKKRRECMEQNVESSVLYESDSRSNTEKVKKLGVSDGGIDRSVTCSRFVRGPCEGLRPRAEFISIGKCSMQQPMLRQTKAATDTFECHVEGCLMRFWTASEFIFHKRQGCTKQLEL